MSSVDGLIRNTIYVAMDGVVLDIFDDTTIRIVERALVENYLADELFNPPNTHFWTRRGPPR